MKKKKKGKKRILESKLLQIQARANFCIAETVIITNVEK